jgi:NAD(P)-dependent dehydrogenase (short-subunit alcohol dehydrogenase family)
MTEAAKNGRKIVLVTGGSRGIGAATCIMAAKRGWDVAVNYASNVTAAEEVVKAANDAGARAIAIKGDVGSEADILSVFKTVDREFGRLDGFVNNAGVVDMKSRLDEMSAKRLERMMRINVVGSILCCREAVKRMSTKHGGKGGSIVNLSSAAAVIGGSNQYIDYAASKGAIDSLTIGLAREIATEGVRVNAVRPGIIETEIHASGGEPDRARQMASNVPVQRAGTAEEVAEAIFWLLSDASSYATGSIVNVTGGR